MMCGNTIDNINSLLLSNDIHHVSLKKVNNKVVFCHYSNSVTISCDNRRCIKIVKQLFDIYDININIDSAIDYIDTIGATYVSVGVYYVKFNNKN